MMGAVCDTKKPVGLSFAASAEGTAPQSSAVVSVANLQTGSSGIVRRFDGGEEFRSQMLALGLIPGMQIKVARGEKGHPYILQLDQNRVMVDWGTIGKIYVQPNPESQAKRGWFSWRKD